MHQDSNIGEIAADGRQNSPTEASMRALRRDSAPTINRNLLTTPFTKSHMLCPFDFFCVCAVSVLCLAAACSAACLMAAALLDPSVPAWGQTEAEGSESRKERR